MQKQVAIIICLLFQSIAWAQSNVYTRDAAHPFVIITNDKVKELPAFSDEEFYDNALSVIFQVNKSAIRRDDPFLETYRKEILPRINSEHLQLRKIYIRGAASPEGSYENNRRLGQARTQALLEELKRDLQHQYLKPEIDLSSVTEDYGHLSLLMQKAGDPDYAAVKKIYDATRGNEQSCKKQLMALQGGTLWSRMQKDYFPQLRSASLVLWFSEPDIEHAPLPELALQPIRYAAFPDGRLVGLPLPLQQLDVNAVPVDYTRRHLIAVRTNLLHDFFYMPNFGWAFSPNIQFEYYPKSGHYTYNAALTWGTHRHWDTQEFFQVRDVQLELRRYFRGKGEFLGAYLGAYAHGDVYGIGLSPTKGWEGEGGGLGLTAGYVMPLNKKGNLRLEFMAAAGFYMSLFDPYVYGNPVTGTVDGDYYYNYLGSASNFKKRNHRFTWFGPTNLGIQLTYDIIYRKKTRK